MLLLRIGGTSRRRSGSPGRCRTSTRPSSRSSTTELGTRVADLDRLAVLAGRSWRVADLPGGLTNHNVRVTSTDDGHRSTSWSGARRATPDCSGSTATTSTSTPRPRQRRASAPPVIEYRPDLRMLAIGFLRAARWTNADFADPGVLTRAADACRRLHAGPRFTGEFDMFQRQATYRADGGGARLPGARRRTTTTPTPGRRYAGRWRPTAADGAMQQRPAGRELHRRRRPGLADRLRVLRQQRRLLRARQHRDRVRLHARADRGVDARRTSAPDAARTWRGSGSRRCAAPTAGRCGASSRRPSSPMDFDFHAWGMERYEKAAADLPRAGLRRAAEDVAA